MKKCILLILLFAFINAKQSTAQIITTCVGNGFKAGTGFGGYSGDGGLATSAELNHPMGVTVDAIGNIYLADSWNNVIRKVNTSGIISTIAGNDTAGYSGDGGLATSAKLKNPKRVAVDATGNIYIADYWNGVIRKVNTSGIISTIAGIGGTTGYSGDGGPAISAKLSVPTDVVVDATGNVFIADCGSNRIRKINTLGIISTIAGDTIPGYSGDGGLATSAKLNRPIGIMIDAIGNIYIADSYNNVIRKINISGIISTFAGNGFGSGTGVGGYSGDGGAAIAAELNDPVHVAIDAAGNIYIAELSARIRKVNTNGIISTFAGGGNCGSNYCGDGGSATLATLYNPYSIAIDAAGNVYIADENNNVIRKVSPPDTIFSGNDFSISIPNVFTPNGDGINDFFTIKSVGVSSIDISIFDRWGIQVWQSPLLTGAWDGKYNGKELTNGTYFYIIKVKTSKDAENNSYKGSLMLIK